MTMRKFIDLFETETRTDENIMTGADDKLQDFKGLEGNVNIRYIANNMLPSVSDPKRFILAFNKIRAGNPESLNRMEALQLALGFISILEMDNQERMRLIRRLAALKAMKPDEDEKP